MNSDANIATHPCIGPKVNVQQNFTGFVEYFYQYPLMISIDMLIISVMERCFRLRLDLVYFYEKS